MGKFIDITGKRFGRLIALNRSETIKKIVYFNCVCDCGNKKKIPSHTLRNGESMSCGCYNLELYGKRNLIHNDTNSPEHRVWCKMKNRCDNKNNDAYKYYGGRGITYCERWKVYKNFLNDMGRKPTALHTLDRIEVNGNYCKENCRWATRYEQSVNRRNNIFYTYNGETKTVSQWFGLSDLSKSAFGYRLKKGWNIDKALNTPRLSNGGTKKSST